MALLLEKSSVCMIGAFPPPVHGMAAVNAAVREQLISAGSNPVVMNIAAQSLARSVADRLGRLPKVLNAICQLLAKPCLRGITLYMSISGGYGQIYEVIFILLARLRRMNLFIHHHSFAYLDRPNWLTRLLTIVAGPSSIHIALSPGMAACLQAQYPSVHRVISLSNAVFFIGDQPISVSRRFNLKSIGFLSNISEEKGIFDFLDLVEACENESYPIMAKLAGPFQDMETELKVHQRLSELTTIEYVGPQYGDNKETFFASIDALIFPTRYINEAEPLTVHEAMQHGLPVIAYGRGSIPEIIDLNCGLVIAPEVSFTPIALNQIKQWLAFPEKYKNASHTAQENFAKAQVRNTHDWHELLQEILGRSNSS